MVGGTSGPDAAPAAPDARTPRSSSSQVSAKTIMAATATAVEVNQAQSIAMIRNLMRFFDFLGASASPVLSPSPSTSALRLSRCPR